MSREMKDSGVEWIGKIPKDWKVIKNKNCFELEKNIVGSSFENYQLLSLTKKGIVKKDFNDVSGKIPDSYSTYQSVRKNQLVLCLFDLDCSAVFSGLSKFDGMISPAYKIYNCKSNIYEGFARYWFDFCFDGRKYKYFSKSLRYVVNTEDFGTVEIALPNILEQKKLANFLDEKVEEIDRLIDNAKKSIEEYKKYKQSIITEAVTKGLDPNVEMKDSGIEWIGEIPKDWTVLKLKQICNARNDKYNDSFGKIDYFGLENIISQTGKYIKTSNEYDLDQSIICKKGDVVFGKLRPYLAKVYEVEKLCCCSSEFAVFCDFDGISTYYKYLFLSSWFVKIVDASTYGTKMPRANIEFIKNMFIPFQNKLEQQKIVDYLDAKCFEIDNLICKKEKLILELESYKKSIIYEYVTGKKEV